MAQDSKKVRVTLLIDGVRSEFIAEEVSCVRAFPTKDAPGLSVSIEEDYIVITCEEGE